MRISDWSSDVCSSDLTGLTTRQVRDEVWTLPLADPDRASGECRWITEMRRGDWSVRTESVATLRCSRETFENEAIVETYEGDDRVHRKTWKRSIPRALMERSPFAQLCLTRSEEQPSEL